jgi:hypothetical protein
MTGFWDAAPCSLTEIDQRFRSAYCLHHQGDEKVMRSLLVTMIMEALSTSETSFYLCGETTRSSIPEASNLPTRRHENINYN